MTILRQFLYLIAIPNDEEIPLHSTTPRLIICGGSYCGRCWLPQADPSFLLEYFIFVWIFYACTPCTSSHEQPPPTSGRVLLMQPQLHSKVDGCLYTVACCFLQFRTTNIKCKYWKRRKNENRQQSVSTALECKDSEVWVGGGNPERKRKIRSMVERKYDSDILVLWLSVLKEISIVHRGVKIENIRHKINYNSFNYFWTLILPPWIESLLEWKLLFCKF